MVDLTSNRLEQIQKGFAGRRIAVIGDLMLDRYFWGRVSRISPEAPVPIVEIEEESTRLGGAANVANNIASLGGIPVIIGAVGKDPGAATLKGLFEEKRFSTNGIIVDETRPTTIKTRVIAHSQHVVRIDQEEKNDISREAQKNILQVLKGEMGKLDGIVLEDYNKGVLTKDLIPSIIGLAKENNKMISVDPKFNNFFDYKFVSVFKPNRKETEEALGCRINTVEDAKKASHELLARLDAGNILMTLGEQGMILLERNGSFAHVETKARHVADVSGAGDTVIATLAMALASGGSMRESATLANYAGGIVCGEVGIVPIDKDMLVQMIVSDVDHKGGR